MELEKRLEIFDALTHHFITKEFREYLINHGFFTAPASTKYHGNYEGGLFDHSLEVCTALCLFTTNNRLRWQRPESPVIVGLFHDLCKIDNYIEKKPGLGVEYETPVYEYNKNTDLSGHGDKSVMLLASHMKLTEEEVMCIRYHMGAFTEKDEWSFYTRAVNNYANVLWTHHADMYASHILGI